MRLWRIIEFLLAAAVSFGIALIIFGEIDSEQRIHLPSNIENCRNPVRKAIMVQEMFGIKFGIVALAQTRLETANRTSRIYKESNNRFGMRHNKRGFSLRKNLDHAYYESEIQSLRDYAAWQKNQLRKAPWVDTEDEYINMLNCLPTSPKGTCWRYATDPSYTAKVRKLVEALKSLEDSCEQSSEL